MGAPSRAALSKLEEISPRMQKPRKGLFHACAEAGSNVLTQAMRGAGLTALLIVPWQSPGFDCPYKHQSGPVVSCLRVIRSLQACASLPEAARATLMSCGDGSSGASAAARTCCILAMVAAGSPGMVPMSMTTSPVA